MKWLLSPACPFRSLPTWDILCFYDCVVQHSSEGGAVILQLEINALPPLVGGCWALLLPSTVLHKVYPLCKLSRRSPVGFLSAFLFCLFHLFLSAVLQRMWFKSTMRVTRWCVKMWNSRPSSKTFTCTGWGAWSPQVRYDGLASSVASQVSNDGKAVCTARLELLVTPSLLGPQTQFYGLPLQAENLPSLQHQLSALLPPQGLGQSKEDDLGL